MDKIKLDKLHRLLEFVQQDLSIVNSKQEKINSFLEAGELFRSIFFRSASGIEVDVPDFVWNLLGMVCADVVVLSKKIIETERKGGTINFSKVFCFFSDIDHPSTDHIFKLKEITENNQISLVPVSITWPEEQTTFGINVHNISLVIFDLLESLPSSRLKLCLDCKKIFVQKTAREKKYCSDLCKNRHNLKQKEAD